MKNNKGFTLVEVIAVIGLLLLIATITVPSVITIQNNNKEKNYNKILETIIASAENYYHGSLELNSTTTTCYIQLKDLANKNLIKTPITDPITNINFSLDRYIEITKDGDNIKFKLLNDNDTPSPNITCPTRENKEQYKDPSGANSPKLAEGMIPVVYDETCESETVADNASGCWEVANTNTEWYNYNEQWWANAVTTSVESYRTEPAGTEIPMSAINSMWVWIPRYSYEIDGTYGKYENGSDGTKESPGLIDVVFDSGTKTIDSTKTVHTAFKFGEKELTGFWVAKFEMSGEEGSPLILPNKKSLAGLKMSILNNSCTLFSNSNNNYGLPIATDYSGSHMIKNTEWGAVAYLSQSKYGKMGNANYKGINKEIYNNNSTETYTGRSGGSPSQANSQFGTYSYNDMTCGTGSSECTGSKATYSGTGASTTGTIYGVYDMNGGAAEYVMAFYDTNYASSSSGFTSLPSYNHLYDYYTDGTFSSGFKYGDATYETMNWYSDYAASSIDSSKPFIRRGGTAVDYNDDGSITVSGIFNYGTNDGGGSSGDGRYIGNTTSRPIYAP